MTDYRLFQPIRQGIFISRPNRFIVIAQDEAGEFRAHCPNPGRLKELLRPGRECFFEAGCSGGRETAYTLSAVDYGGTIIPLYSAGANRIAARLLLPRLYPSAEEIRPEFRLGSSRFDFLVCNHEVQTLIEIKACTLVEHGTAMFPDAPTKRGLRHIEELSALAREGKYRAHVIFVVANPAARRFVPGLHTDPEFAAALISAAGSIELQAVTSVCDSSGWVHLVNTDLPIELEPALPALDDSGVYLLRTRLTSSKNIMIGALGILEFPAGVYVYVGSAKRGLSHRTARHLRHRKKKHWHIDYLMAETAERDVFPIRTYKDLECTLAVDLRQLCGDGVPGFGSSDCRCPSHLFLLPEDRQDYFDKLILRYRHRDAI